MAKVKNIQEIKENSSISNNVIVANKPSSIPTIVTPSLAPLTSQEHEEKITTTNQPKPEVVPEVVNTNTTKEEPTNPTPPASQASVVAPLIEQKVTTNQPKPEVVPEVVNTNTTKEEPTNPTPPASQASVVAPLIEQKVTTNQPKPEVVPEVVNTNTTKEEPTNPTPPASNVLNSAELINKHSKSISQDEDVKQKILILVNIAKNSTFDISQIALNKLKKISDTYNEKIIIDTIYQKQINDPIPKKFQPLSQFTNFKNKISYEEFVNLIDKIFANQNVGKILKNIFLTENNR